MPLAVNNLDTQLSNAAIHAEFARALAEAPGIGGDLAATFNVIPKNGGSETGKLPIIGQVPAMREWIASREIKGLDAYSVSYTLKAYESTVAIHNRQMRTDNLGLIRLTLDTYANEFAHDTTKKMQTMWNEMIASGTKDNYLTIDSLSFFSDSHAAGWLGPNSAAWDNMLDLACTYANIWTAITRLQSVTGGNGRKMGVQATHIIFAQNLEQTVKEALEGTYVPGASNLTPNTLRGRLTPILAPELTDGYWMVADLSRGFKPFAAIVDETSRQYNVFAPRGSEISQPAWMTNSWTFGVDEYKTVIPALPFLVVASDGVA
jgi:phage major head subunit gpT-like protein